VKNSHESVVNGPNSCVPQPGLDPCPIIEYLPFVASYSVGRSGTDSSSDVTLTATAGMRGLGSSEAKFQDARANASGNFIHFNLDANHTQNLGSDIVAALRLSGQVADGPLVSTEQFAAGGFSSVRGYFQSETIGDDGVLGSAELRSPSLGPYLFSFVDEWRFYTFFDAANLWMLDPLKDQQSAFSIYSTGFGTRLQLFKYLTGDVVLAFPLRNSVTTTGRQPAIQFSVKAAL
jgi:hemolysin activation/secretion protein